MSAVAPALQLNEGYNLRERVAPLPITAESLTYLLGVGFLAAGAAPLRCGVSCRGRTRCRWALTAGDASVSAALSAELGVAAAPLAAAGVVAGPLAAEGAAVSAGVLLNKGQQKAHLCWFGY